MKNGVYIGIIAVLALVLGVLAYKYNKAVNDRDTIINSQESTITQGDLERGQLEIDLQRMLISYDTLKTENSMMIAEMASQRTEIEGLLKNVKNKNWSVHKLKKEAETLRNIMKGYVVTIDSLNTANEHLTEQVGSLQEGIASRDTQISGLESDKVGLEAMVSTGQMLQTGNESSTTIRVRNNGKQVETSRASKTEMVKTCFTIIRNPITKPGSKTLYMKVSDSSGKVLKGKDGDAKTDLGGSSSFYSVKRTIDYNNQQMDVCIFHEFLGELSRGDYKVEIFENGEAIATSDFTLK